LRDCAKQVLRSLGGSRAVDYPAVVRRGPLQVAISAAGHRGALAQRLRRQLESQFGPEWESWLRWLGEAGRHFTMILSASDDAGRCCTG
jgi:siroheme synthase (precorrin-2 oxidase/ferrochelatase)